MMGSDDLYGLMEVGDDLSTALSTETLADRDMMSPSFDYTPGSSAYALPIEIFEHRKFLRAYSMVLINEAVCIDELYTHLHHLSRTKSL
jgi:hypothetical protein